jgi:hypothetical protein
MDYQCDKGEPQKIVRIKSYHSKKVAYVTNINKCDKQLGSSNLIKQPE